MGLKAAGKGLSEPPWLIRRISKRIQKKGQDEGGLLPRGLHFLHSPRRSATFIQVPIICVAHRRRGAGQSFSARIFIMAHKHSPAFLKIVEEARSRIRECQVDDVRQMLDAGESFELVDVREESEYARGHLPKARHIGKGVIERDIESEIPDSQTRIVLYCGGGYRSALAADALQRMGYTQVLSMDGGWRGWTEAGLPVEGGQS